MSIVIEKFGNPMSFVSHLAHSVIKLKCDPEEGERCSHLGEGGEGVGVRPRRGAPFGKRDREEAKIAVTIGGALESP
ncbi:hypothetical protein AVEN_178822-1 [Araneus ventricosus]|uniref:Uncharacterized protein n=1 Tax=Araneus ventricosus TaxID=182803 RepID=A0A4Y2BDK2_ARAVE|nr:hypothetical protein AVEN_178822-1 [Araneus ventricosus]